MPDEYVGTDASRADIKLRYAGQMSGQLLKLFGQFMTVRGWLMCRSDSGLNFDVGWCPCALLDSTHVAGDHLAVGRHPIRNFRCVQNFGRLDLFCNSTNKLVVSALEKD